MVKPVHTGSEQAAAHDGGSHGLTNRSIAKMEAVIEFAEALARVARNAAAPFERDAPDLANVLNAAATGTEQLAATVRGSSDAVRKGGFTVLLLTAFVIGLALPSLLRTSGKRAAAP